MCFSAPKINVPPPPPAPEPPKPSPQEEALRAKQTELMEENLVILRQTRAQDEASRVAFEKATGMPLGEFVAQQAKAQVGLGDLTRAGQERQLAREARMEPLEEEALRGTIDAYKRALAREERLDPLQEGVLRQQLTAMERDLADREQARTQLEARREAFVKATGLSPEEAEVGEAKRQLDISTELHGRFQKALKGELPVDPALERALGEQETSIREDVLRRTGPGGDLGDIGLRNIAEFRKRAEELRYKARTGVIGEAEQYGMALSPALLRVGATRDMAASRGGGAPLSTAERGLALPPDVFSRPSTAGLMIPGLFRGRIMESPPQLGDLARSYFADRALKARAGELGYQGLLQNVSLKTGAHASQAAFDAAQQQALINGMFGLAGIGVGAMV